jgi:hypothetical protein
VPKEGFRKMTEQRRRWVEELNAAGVKASLKENTDRLRRKYLKFKKDEQKKFDHTPNRFAMSSTERNRNKRLRRKRNSNK